MKQIRSLTAQEELYWRLTYNDQIHPVIAGEVEGTFSLEEMERALALIQQRHALLRVTVEMPSDGTSWTQPVFVQSDRAIPVCEVCEASLSSVADQMEAELAEPFIAGVGPLMRAVVMRRGSTNVLILSASHSVADGMSMLQILRDLLRALSGTAFDDPPIAATAESLLDLPPVTPERATLEPDLAPRKAGQPPKVALLTLSRSDTDDLIANARAHHVTVHSLLVAAVASSMRFADPGFQRKPIRVISPVSARAVLGAGSVVGLYFTSPMSVLDPATTDAWEAAAQVRADVTTAATRTAILQSTLGMRSLTKPGLTNAAAAAVLEGAFATDAIVSNLGRLPDENDFGGLRIVNVWGPAVLAGRDEAQTIGAVTVNGSLSLTLTSRAPLPQILERTVERLKAP